MSPALEPGGPLWLSPLTEYKGSEATRLKARPENAMGSYFVLCLLLTPSCLAVRKPQQPADRPHGEELRRWFPVLAQHPLASHANAPLENGSSTCNRTT